MNINKKLLNGYHCQEPPTDCVFKHLSLVPEKEAIRLNKEVNYLVFFLSGKAKITSNLFDEVLFERDDIFFLPRLSDCKVEIIEDTNILVHTFNNSSCNVTRCILNNLYTYSQNFTNNDVTYVCKLKSVPAFKIYSESILNFIKDGHGDSSIWHIKHQEVFQMLKKYYDRDILRSFLLPMLSEVVPFKSTVLTHAKHANNVKELADLCGYGIVNFRRLFKKQFGMPVFQWLQAEKAKRIRYALTTSDLSIKEITNEYGFQSASHFSKFCKQYLGDIPSNIRKTAKRSNI